MGSSSLALRIDWQKEGQRERAAFLFRRKDWMVAPQLVQKQAVNCELSSASYINFPVDHRRDGKLHSSPRLIAVSGLITVIQLMGNVVRIVGMQNGRSASMLVYLQCPDDPI